MSEKRFDASCSRVFLCRNNYYGPRLLLNINLRPNMPPFKMAQIQTPLDRQTTQDPDEDYMALPLSSDEEEAKTLDITRSPGALCPAQNESDIMVSPTRSKQRRDGNMATRRGTKRKLEDEPSLESRAVLPSDDATAEEVFDLLMTSSQKSAGQKRKLQKGYANRKYARHSEVAESVKTEAGDKFILYRDDYEDRPPVAAQDQFVHHDVITKLSPAKSKRKSRLDVAELPPESALPRDAGFSIPDMPAAFTSSATTTTDDPSIFDGLQSPNHDRQRTRARSMSSLSSLDSIASLKLEQDHEEGLLRGDADPRENSGVTVRCPVCQKRVKRQPEEGENLKLGALPLQKQQDFCYRHQVRDARAFWTQQGYPDVDWHALEDVRIPKHLPALTRVLQRKASSYYLTKLDSKIAAAKGSRKVLRTYLHEEVLDVANQGYYGPKGARIMVNAVTEALAKDLTTQLRTDPSIRAAGVGAYVSAVLVPELALRLVMEDLKTNHQERAINILAESTQVGILLNPDDDHVERGEGEDDD